MIRSTFEKRVNIELQTQINELSNSIQYNLYMVNDQSLKNEIFKNLKRNKLSLKQLKIINSLLFLIKDNPSNTLLYYNNLKDFLRIKDE
jgi:hypothetical protein